MDREIKIFRDENKTYNKNFYCSKTRYNFKWSKRFLNNNKYMLPTPEEYITNADAPFKKGYRTKRIFRLDILDPKSTKASTDPLLSDYLGSDSGEVKTSKVSILGEDALINPHIDQMIRNARILTESLFRDSTYSFAWCSVVRSLKQK